MTIRKTLALLTLGTALAITAPLSAHAADTYKLDPSHTTVIWNANHFQFSNPHGLFSMIDGSITLDEAAPEKSSVKATINTGNLFTGNAKFDDHLKAKDFFNVAEFPSAEFVSTKVEKTGEKTAKVTGNLTMLGVTKPLTLDVTLNHKGEHFMTKAPTVGFTATGVIKRSEWGINYAIPGVSDDVKITIEAEANKEANKEASK